MPLPGGMNTSTFTLASIGWHWIPRVPESTTWKHFLIVLSLIFQPSLLMLSGLLMMKGLNSRGWRNVEFVPTLTIFFLWIWLTPPPPLPTIYSMFSKFQCFFWMFFWHMHLFFLDSCTHSFCLPIHQFKKIHTTLENVVSRNLCLEEHMWEITESSEFCELHRDLHYYYRDWCA